MLPSSRRPDSGAALAGVATAVVDLPTALGASALVRAHAVVLGAGRARNAATQSAVRFCSTLNEVPA